MTARDRSVGSLAAGPDGVHSRSHSAVPLLLALLFVGVWSGSTATVLAVVCLSAPLILADPLVGLCLYITTSTSGTFFAIIEGSSLSRFYGCLYIAAVLLLGLRKRNMVRLQFGAVCATSSMIALNAISVMYSMSPDASLSAFGTMALNIGVFLATVSYQWDDTRGTHMLSDCVSMTLAFFAAYIIGNYAVSTYAGRLSLSSVVNPNQFAMSVAQLSIVPGIRLSRARRVGERIILGFLFSVGVLLLLGTGSRSSSFGLILGATYAVLVTRGRSRATQGWARLIAMIVLLCGLYLVWLLLGVLDPITAGRYTFESVFEGQGTGRLGIWHDLIKYVIPDHLLLGVGLGGENVATSLSVVGSLYERPAHNMLLDLIAQVGLLGLLVYGVFFALTYRKALSVAVRHPSTLSLAAIFMVSIGVGVGETMFSNKILWISAAVCWKYGRIRKVESEPGNRL